MKHLYGIFALFLAAPLIHAEWVMQTISNATEGHMASRVILNGERTLAAYRSGNALMAATSTGGLTGKRWGRIGDSPLIGAGTLADDRSVGVSCTGTGEAFIRAGVGHEMGALVRLAG
jgi:hypothetical protein